MILKLEWWATNGKCGSKRDFTGVCKTPVMILKNDSFREEQLHKCLCQTKHTPKAF